MAEAGRGPVAVQSSAVFLSGANPLRRLPRAPRRRRPDAFWAAFEDRALIYDCFWTADGKEIVLAAPPPNTLMAEWEGARIVARPSGRPLVPRFHVSRSTMTVALGDVPAGTVSIGLKFGGEDFEVPVQPNLGAAFAGRRVMFTMNKDNELGWMRLWADWHARLHGVDAVIVFDNGSTRYDADAIAETLLAVPGIAQVAVPVWPHRYGPVDPAVLFHPYWANFLQVASFRVTLSRLAPKARGILNCDIDELVGIGAHGDVFAALDQSPDGLVRLKGTWVETAVAPDAAAQPHHLRYRYRHTNPLKAVCADKWALDPQSEWARDFAFTPMMHRIYGLSRAAGTNAPRLPFFHFKAINTNWKEERNRAQASDTRTFTRLSLLDEQIAHYLTGNRAR